jgi:DNA invertase Pin-like site-specific DNA recombinase
MTDSLSSSKITPDHLERWAYIFVRQSDPQQPVKHPESTARQYALVDRAIALGWPRERVKIIDEDQGKSGATAEGRLGFHYLLAEVALDRVGLILSTEVSRPTRSCNDWFPLLELCARFHTLLGDGDGLYDPTVHNDRLLLGLKGMFSEAELHILKERMYKAKLNKESRGELFELPPIGYVKLPSGAFAIDPDEQVQAVVRLIFDEFDRQGTVHGLLRYLVKNKVQVPVRSRLRETQGQLEWHRPNRPTLLNLLRHPIYAGAYRHGHRAIDPKKKKPGNRHSGRQYLPPQKCRVLIKGRLPAYISWERFEANQRRLAANANQPDTPGAPRKGAALLCGLLYCGRCKRRMQVHYGGKKNAPTYACTRNSSDYGDPLCQSLSGQGLDELVAAEMLKVVEPAALEASLAAVADLERERAGLLRQWNLKIERVRYEAERARRQYQACEPENRLVARTLEKDWEEALRRQRQVEEEFGAWQRSAPSQLSLQDQEAVRALAEDLPALWRAPTTTGQDRQRMARLLLERVTVVVDKESDAADVKLHWKGGVVTGHRIKRPVSRYDQQASYPQLVKRLKELSSKGLSSAAMAEQLNDDGFVPPKRTDRFSRDMVQRLLGELGLKRRKRHGSPAGLGADEYRPGGLARKLEVKRDTVVRWMRVGWVNVRRDAENHRIIWADADELERLRELHRLPRTWENKARLAELKKPKQRPKE